MEALVAGIQASATPPRSASSGPQSMDEEPEEGQCVDVPSAAREGGGEGTSVVDLRGQEYELCLALVSIEPTWQGVLGILRKGDVTVSVATGTRMTPCMCSVKQCGEIS